MTLESARLAGSSPRGEIASGRAAQQEKLCLRRGGVIATAIARWLDTVERTRYIAEHAVRQDPVLPRDVIGHVVDNGCEGVMSPDTHLMDDEDGREWRMAILDVNGDGLAVERPKTGFIRVVDKYEFLNLFLVDLGRKQRQIKLTSGQKRMK